MASTGRNVTIDDFNEKMLMLSRKGVMINFMADYGKTCAESPTDERQVHFIDMAGLYIVVAGLLAVAIFVSFFEKKKKKERKDLRKTAVRVQVQYEKRITGEREI
jgi:hypothetical protein